MSPCGISPETQAQHLAALLALAGLPTASGREHRVIRWVESWAAARPWLAVDRDACGNMILRRADDPGDRPALYFTAHLDHPAFVVERLAGSAGGGPPVGHVELSFRGGVMADYFADAAVVIDASGGAGVLAVLTGKAPGPDQPFPRYMARVEGDASAVTAGDVATWDLPGPELIGGLVHAPACDDLAAAAAALCSLDVLGPMGPAPARVLLTRAEEIGFVGAIGACRAGTIPASSRLLVLENSRSFDDSPVGGGPIVRVGDRLSVFSPALTGACARVAEALSGSPATPTASQKVASRAWPWQRKLMSGGACEATVFCGFGFEATCLCLPLGNYHNMADLAAVQAGTNTSRPRVAREFISAADYHGLIDLLVACGRGLPADEGLGPRLEKLWAGRSFVLDRATIPEESR